VIQHLTTGTRRLIYSQRRFHSLRSECNANEDKNKAGHHRRSASESISSERTRCRKDRIVRFFCSWGTASDSDIDLLVEFEAGRKTFDAFIKLSFFLEDVLHHRVELVTMEALSPYIGPYILKEVEYAALAA